MRIVRFYILDNFFSWAAKLHHIFSEDKLLCPLTAKLSLIEITPGPSTMMELNLCPFVSVRNSLVRIPNHFNS